MLYKELAVWQKSHALALKTIRAVDGSRRSYASEIVARQLVGAVCSTGANIAEGYGRHSSKDYVRFLRIAYGSANEADNWLAVLRDAEMIQETVANELVGDNEEILRMLATMIRRIEASVKQTGTTR